MGQGKGNSRGKKRTRKGDNNEKGTEKTQRGKEKRKQEMTILQAWALVFFSGIGLMTLVYLAYRHFVRGKIICYIYNKNRFIYKKAARPDELGLLHVEKKTYYYRENEVLTTKGFLLSEPFPALVFEEGRPNPVNLWQKRAAPLGAEDLSSMELSKILNDGTVRDFVEAQSRISLSQVTGIIVVTSLILLAAIVGTGYWIKMIPNGQEQQQEYRTR